MTENENKEQGDAKQEEIDLDEELEDDAEVEDKEPTSEELEALFNKNTESFRCLAQILISRSSLWRNPFYYFPPLEDPGIDVAFDYEDPTEEIDNVCAEKYKKLCQDFNIKPISRIVKCLPTNTLNLKFYGLNDKQIRALSKALRHNTYVKELILEENFLTPDGAYQLAAMLQENNSLRILNLKHCRLGPEGASKLGEGIMTTQSLQELDLSHNCLGTEGIKALKQGLQENVAVYKLNLSHNELEEAAATHLAGILKENISIEDLNLSWNMLSTPVAMKIICDEGLMENNYLTSLNLAWNGIASKLTVKPLMKYLKAADTLNFLDLSNNRITGAPLNMLRGAIRTNTSLLGINLGFNPLSPDEVLSLVQLLTLPANQRPPLEILDMDNIYVKREFLPVWKTATKLGRHVKIGGVFSNYKIVGPNIPRLLFDRVRTLAMKPKQKKAQRDFSHFVLTLPDKPMRNNEFQDALKKFKMKLVDKDLVEEITKNFKYKKHGVDVAKMKEMYLELYPDAQPPPKKKAKHKGKKKQILKVTPEMPAAVDIIAEIIEEEINNVTKDKSQQFTKEMQTNTQEIADDAEENLNREGNETFSGENTSPEDE